MDAASENWPPPGADLATLNASLFPYEIWWRDHYDWLLQQGFKLRPRYRPDWVASWKATGAAPSDSEDFHRLFKSNIIDAEHEGRIVVLKLISQETEPEELRVTKLLCTEPLISDPRNRCIPVLRILDVPDNPNEQILVMPLMRLALDPSFLTVGEAMQCIRQIFEGIQFMHGHNVAHRDCTEPNFMYDPSSIYPQGFHFIKRKYDMSYRKRAFHYSRTERPPKYYLIDFGLSTIPNPENPKALPVWATDKTAPEFQNGRHKTPYDPFPTDVYYLGNWIRVDLIDGEPPGPHRDVFGMYGLEFLRPLVQDMVQDDPAKRPKMDEVTSRFKQIELGLSKWKLWSRVIRKESYNPLTNWFFTLKHWFWVLKLTIRGIPPTPVPS